MEESFFGNEIDTTGLDDLGDVDCSGGVYSCGDSSSCAEEELMNNGPSRYF